MMIIEMTDSESKRLIFGISGISLRVVDSRLGGTVSYVIIDAMSKV